MGTRRDSEPDPRKDPKKRGSGPVDHTSKPESSRDRSGSAPPRQGGAPDEEFEETQTSSPGPQLDSPAEQLACLIIISHHDPNMLGRQFNLNVGDELIIGRSSEAQICLKGLPVVSRRHARLWRTDAEVMLEDLGSRNGTLLQGERIDEPVRLQHGDQFSVETVHFRFISGSNVEQAFHEAIYDMVTHDDLTKIYNRRKYEKEIERDFARAVRHNRPLSIVIFDVDVFKEINDNHGHLCGDAVLRQLAALVGTQLRREGIFARYGGDEFVVLCPEIEARGARVLAERLRMSIASHVFQFRDLKLAVTCSFGVAERTPDMKQPSDLYAAADARLYAAKAGGRNRSE